MKLPIENAHIETVRPNDPLQAKILDVLQAGETTLDELRGACAESTAQLLAALCVLEMAGFIESRPDSRYAPASAAARC